MRSALAILIAAAALGVHPVSAQAIRARSGDYLFVASASDARALWLNPAGLAVRLEASILGEIVLDRPVGSDIRLGQWTLGLNTRGLAFGYQRDRLRDGRSSGTFRLGTALRFRGGAFGAAFTFYRAPTTQRAGDIGLRYRLLDIVDAGVVLRNIGRPAVHDSLLPLEGVMGLRWAARPSVVEIAAEVHVAERLGASGYDVAYRAGVRLATVSALPLGAIAAFDLGSNFRIGGFTVGVAVGGGNRGVALGSAVPTSSHSVRFDRFSLTGIASRRPGARRR